MAIALTVNRFFEMEQRLRFRKHAIAAVTKFVDLHEKWPSSWEELKPYIDGDLVDGVTSEVIIDFNFDLDSSVSEAAVARAINTRQRSLPEEHLLDDINVLKAQIELTALANE